LLLNIKNIMITPALSIYRLLSGIFFLSAAFYILRHINANGKATDPLFGRVVMVFTMLAGFAEILSFFLNLFPRDYTIAS
jgi:hypothetical protein